MLPTQPHHRRGLSHWSWIALLAGVFGMIVISAYAYLFPAMRVATGADAMARKHLAAISSLVLAIVLVCVLAALVLILKPGRMLLPRKSPPRSRTRYVDAWSESAKRMKTPPDET